MTAHQLLLPVVGRRRPERREAHKAKREMSQVAFDRAVSRAGFEPTAGGLMFRDIETNRVFAGVCVAGSPHLSRRATLAKIRRERA